MNAVDTSPEVDHYVDSYWNDLPQILEYLCRRATGRPELWWMDYLKQKYAPVPFKCGLVIACGNGWVERDLLDRGVCEQFDAFDPAEHYLREAEAQKGARSIHYFRDSFEHYRPERTYDLIVNVAALHHAQYLYRHVERLAGALSPDGIFVNWEYVGPSRNQYSDAHVRLMSASNAALAPRFRTRHGLRPDLWHSIRGDITEAVHSADILTAVGAYFDVLEFKELGGGIAYQILWNNTVEFAEGDGGAQAALSDLIRLDDELTDSGSVPNLFAFFVCRRRQQTSAGLAAHRFAWRRLIEPTRERFARWALGFYPGELLVWLARSVRAWIAAPLRDLGRAPKT